VFWFLEHGGLASQLETPCGKRMEMSVRADRARVGTAGVGMHAGGELRRAVGGGGAIIDKNRSIG
jgi:hypothetical protein